MTQDELDQRTNGLLDRLSKNELEELIAACKKLENEQIREALERASKGGDRD